MNEFLAIDPDCENDIDFKSGVMCLLFPKTHNMCIYISASTINFNNLILRLSSEQYYHHYYVVKSMNIYIQFKVLQLRQVGEVESNLNNCNSHIIKNY